MFEIHLQEIEIQNINCFQFTMPDCEADSADRVEITIYYGNDIENNKMIRFTVWARVGLESFIKGFIIAASIPSADDNEINIVSILNESDEFKKILNRYISFIVNKGYSDSEEE